MFKNALISRLRVLAAYLYRLVMETYRHFIVRDCQHSAAALTYVSLFALVPVLTLVYSMVSVLPASEELDQQIQRLIFDNLVPSSGQALQDHLYSFTDRARSLTLPGVIMLVVTAYLMLKTIEKTFNKIWGVSKTRSGLSSFLIYWAILTLGPILIGAGIVMSTYLLSMELMVGDWSPAGLAAIIFEYLPGVLAAAAFTLFFALVPNCYVPVRDAAIGGVITALLFEVGKNLFADIVAKTSYQTIYGAFAIIPLFLLWIFVLWVLVLGGAVLVRTIAFLRIESRSQGYSDLVAALVVLHAIYQGMQTGKSVRPVTFFRLGVHPEQFNRIRNVLIKDGLIAETRAGRFLMGRTLDSISVADVARIVGSDGVAAQSIVFTTPEPWQKELERRLSTIEENQATTLAIALADLFTKPEPPLETPRLLHK